MPCGACAKRRQRLQAKNQKASAVSRTLKRTKKKRSIKTMAANMPKRCPICQSGTKRVSKAGKNLLRCVNPKCSYVRKL
jgi:NAD-dependent DNA ligase